MRHVAVITQPRSSSGLGGYLADALARTGAEVDVVNALDSRIHKVLPILRSLALTRDAWWRRRWENTLFSSWAWRRNTERNGKLLAKVRRPNTLLLQVGKEYFPHPDHARDVYYVYVLYNMKLSLADGVTPWLPPKQDIPRFLELETDLFRRARHIFVGGSYVKANLVDEYGVPAERVTVAGGGVNHFYLDHAASVVPDHYVYRMIFVGWDFGMKGGRVLLEALQLARQTLPGLELDVVGPDPAQQIPCDGVVWHGRVQDKNRLIELYRNADLFVMPSLRDSYGFVFLEAMTQGLPCIGTNMNAMPDIIDDGQTGYLVPPRNASALAAAILRYYEKVGNRGQMGRTARQRVGSKFTWDLVVKQMAKIMWAEG